MNLDHPTALLLTGAMLIILSIIGSLIIEEGEDHLDNHPTLANFITLTTIAFFGVGVASLLGSFWWAAK